MCRNEGRYGRSALEMAARTFPRLSLDMIYARPGQTPEAWGEELREALSYGPEHVSPYQLTIEAGTAFDRAVRRGQFTPPDDELGAALYDTTQAVLEAAGGRVLADDGQPLSYGKPRFLNGPFVAMGG